MSLSKRVRRVLLLSGRGLMVGCLVAALVLDWTVWYFAAALFGAFNCGVELMAHALAEDYEAMRRQVREQAEINKRIVERAKR